MEQFTAWYEGSDNTLLVRIYRGFKKGLQKLLSYFDPALARISDNAFILSTSSAQGDPTSRVVLLKGYSRKGFEFYTNYHSLKSQHLDQNPKAQALFYSTYPLRQIRITGSIEKLSKEENQLYWSTRPRGSQLSALASHQSAEIQSKNELLQRVGELKDQYKDQPIPCPDFWGGYRLVPNYYEFWQGRVNRLHDRIFYKKEGSTWKSGLLAP